MKIYHYSNNDIKGKINPSFFGNNSYTNNSQRISGIKRSFFYIENNRREYFLYGAKYLYICDINEKYFYDIQKDEKNIIKKSNGDIYQALKNKGYKGAIGNNGFSCLVSFIPLAIKQKIVLTR